MAKQHCKVNPHLDRQLSDVNLVDFRHTAVGESDLPRSHLLRPYSQVGLLVSNRSLTAGMRLIPWIWSCVRK